MSVRSLVSRLANHKPIRQWRNRLKGERSWQNYERLFDRDVALRLGQTPVPAQRLKVMFWSPLAAWKHTLIESFLATHLRLRGHEVVTAMCDGGQPHCCMERSGFKRPLCNVCEDQALYQLRAFRRPTRRLSEFVTPARQQQTLAECRQLDAAGLQACAVHGIALGLQAARYLTSYYNGFVPLEENLATAQRVLAGELLYTRYAEAVVAQERPDVVVMFSGNDASFHGPFRRMKQMGVRLVTWDESPQWKDGFYFAHNTCAGDVPLADLWPSEAATPLNAEQQAAISGYLEDWSRGKASAINYHPNPQSDEAALRERLQLPPGRPLLVAFSNVVWDSNVLTKNAGFRDMREWLQVLVDWFAAHPDCLLVVRAHPGERKIPQAAFQTRSDSTLPALLRCHYPAGLPANVRVVPAEDDTDSYTLGRMADAVTVYTTNIGFELALRGKQAWVGGLSIYRGKGFTCDLEGPAHLRQMLNAGKWAEPLPPAQGELARRFLHFWVFRYATRFPWHRRAHANLYSEVLFKDFRFLLPGGDPALDAVAERILDGRPFVDVPPVSRAVWQFHGESRWQSA